MQMQDVQKDVDSAVINFDGIFFSMEDDKWNFTFVDFRKPHDIIENELGCKYSIMLFDDKGIDWKYDLFDAFLIDAGVYLKELLNSGQEGLIIKKCELSEKIINAFIERNKQ